jgi:type IV secretory pathway VirD2 relaxase
MRDALYVQREGAGRNGDRVEVFDRELDRADGAGFVERARGDRRHFRTVIAPERGAEIGELKNYTRELMQRVEQDLGHQLDWIAAAHFDTGRPHVHLLIRGRLGDGRDLLIPTDYVSYRFRQRAEELATQTLGPRLEHTPDRPADRIVNLARVTQLDRALLERARDGIVDTASLPPEDARRAVLVRRLNQLENWGLVQRYVAGAWRVEPTFESKLTRWSEQREREHATARLQASRARSLEPKRTRMLETAPAHEPAVGRLVGFERMTFNRRGPALIGVDGIDGMFWTARVLRIEALRALNGVERGAIVRIERALPTFMPSDKTIWEIAIDNGFAYSAERHRQVRPTDRTKYIVMHERRLEALRRDGLVERAPDGRFMLPQDYLARVAARESAGGRESARVTLLDPRSVEQQVRYAGPTWLDRLADAGDDKGRLVAEGFGAEVKAAWRKRAAFLKELGLAQDIAGSLRPSPGWKERLRALEEMNALENLERTTGRVAHFARAGDRVSGLFGQKLFLSKETYAVLLQERTATLVPWRPEMDRALNQLMAGRVDGRGFDYKVGREAEKALARGMSLAR